MPAVAYKPKQFNPEHSQIIRRANTIAAEYRAQGYDLTLRQLYYQFVSRGWLANNDKNYKRLGGVINDARLAGQLDWDYIVDRTRFLRAQPTWAKPQDIVKAAARQYEQDKWKDQPTRAEVWIEKDALVGVLEQACRDEQVGFFSCRGYTSQSEVWAAAQRIGGYLRSGQNVTIFHLGDHDPSGIDMSRDIEERLQMFIEKDSIDSAVAMVLWDDAPVDPATGKQVTNGVDWERLDPDGWEREVAAVNRKLDEFGEFNLERIALTWEQIEEYDPPPNPAKLTDSRAGGYVARFGYESWELDALPPNVLGALVRDSVASVRDVDLWEEAVEREEEARESITAAARQWHLVQRYLVGDTA